MTYASRDSDVKTLVAWWTGSDPKLNCGTPGLTTKYRILMLAYLTNVIEESTLEKIKSDLLDSDKTDTRQDYLLMIENARLSDSERDARFEEFYNSHTKWTCAQLGVCLRGFNIRWLPYSHKERFFQRYFDKLEWVLTDFDKEYAKAFYNDFDFDFYDDYGQLVKNFESLASKVDRLDLFWQKKVLEDLGKFKNRHRVQQFALGNSI